MLDVPSIGYTHMYKGWFFELREFNVIQNAHRITAEKDGITEAVFVKKEYLTSKEKFIKECKRFYVNDLDSL